MNKKVVKNSLEGIAQVHLDRIGKVLKMAGPVFDNTYYQQPEKFAVLDVCRGEGEVLVQTPEGVELIVGTISYKLKHEEMKNAKWSKPFPDHEHVTNINGKDLVKSCSRKDALESLKAVMSPT